LIKKQREECIVLLDDCFDCRSAADKLTANGVKVDRFSVRFPAPHNADKREQGVKDGRVIHMANQHRYLLFTSDKSMRETHAEDLLKTDLAVVASASNTGEGIVEIFTNAFIKSKAKIYRDFKGKKDRPYFCILQRSGVIEHRAIQPAYKRQSDPRFEKSA
jgi:hypothetical protein